MSDSIALSIISPNCHLPTQIVNCQSGWKAIDLKRHLSKVYPGNPQVEGQRLIFSGQLVGDDIILESLFDKNPVSRTVHLVLDPLATKKATSPVYNPSIGLPNSDDEIDKLRKEYLGYLREYYQNAPGNEMNGQAPWTSEYTKYISQIQNNCATATVPPSYQQPRETPEAVVEQNPNRRNALHRIGRFFGNRANNVDENGAGAANFEEGQEEGFDFVEFVYAVFRISLMVTICVIHSSWQRMLLVGFVAAFFYLHNEGRRNRRVDLVQPPRLLPAPAPQPAVPQAGSLVSAQPGVPESPTNSSQEINIHVEPESSVTATEDKKVSEGASEGTTSNAESPQPINPPTNALRFIALTSFRFLHALVTSLVPELPVHLD